VIVSDPVGALVALHVPVPPDSVTVHSAVEPVVIATVPVGVPVVAVTVAVKVTKAPGEAGFGEADTVVVVAAPVIVSAAVPVELLYPFPLVGVNVAVIVSVPTGAVFTMQPALPAVTADTQSVLPPVVNVTVPVAAAGLTVAE